MRGFGTLGHDRCRQIYVRVSILHASGLITHRLQTCFVGSGARLLPNWACAVSKPVGLSASEDGSSWWQLVAVASLDRSVDSFNSTKSHKVLAAAQQQLEVPQAHQLVSRETPRPHLAQQQVTMVSSTRAPHQAALCGGHAARERGQPPAELQVVSNAPPAAPQVSAAPARLLACSRAGSASAALYPTSLLCWLSSSCSSCCTAGARSAAASTGSALIRPSCSASGTYSLHTNQQGVCRIIKALYGKLATLHSSCGGSFQRMHQTRNSTHRLQTDSIPQSAVTNPSPGTQQDTLVGVHILWDKNAELACRLAKAALVCIIVRHVGLRTSYCFQASFAMCIHQRAECLNSSSSRSVSSWFTIFTTYVETCTVPSCAAERAATGVSCCNDGPTHLSTLGRLARPSRAHTANTACQW